MNTHLALLRGINVGGKNIIKMEDLRKMCREIGFEDVQTYIQSGNIVFGSKESDTVALENLLEKSIAKSFGIETPVLVVSYEKMKAIVENLPSEFSQNPDEYKLDVIFLKDEINAEEFAARIPQRDGVDKVFTGKGVIYISRLAAQASKSKFSKINAMPEYKMLSVRNLRTTKKLWEIMDQLD